MQDTEFIKAIKAKLQFNKIDALGADTAIDLYLPISLQRLWNAYPWDEKRFTETLTFASGDYESELSDDFEQVTGMVIKGNVIYPPLNIVSQTKFESLYPNIAQEVSGTPAMAMIVKNNDTEKLIVRIAPKSSQDFTIEVTGRGKVPDFATVPNYLLPTLEKYLIEDMTMPTSASYMAAAAASAREGQNATNVTPKAVSLKDNTGASIGRDGVHIFNVQDGME